MAKYRDRVDGPHNIGTRISSTRTLEDVILPSDIVEQLDAAMEVARDPQALDRDYGLNRLYSYGCGCTFLFYGPPGTGKTALAEAIAHETGKDLLVVDYSQLKNKYIGETEKNIAAAFQRASEENCVLFWDEADAILRSRNQESRGWEVSQVNVLLSELEKFKGICIFATNHAYQLDFAIDRRIRQKMRFISPDQPMREAIWKKALSVLINVSSSVTPEELAEHELTGGEIANVIHRAAARAYMRRCEMHADEAMPITIDDFLEEIRIERNGGMRNREDDSSERASTEICSIGNLQESRKTLNDLVLPEAFHERIDQAITFARNPEHLQEAYGLDELYPYGTGCTFLFWGPPGTGKTALAEAIAFSMGKKILTVNYAQMINKYIGETEKGIEKAFKTASEQDCVLFIDEADAVLRSRDQESRSWEVSHVNVLLIELEKFRGVCIFATNHADHLDPSIERRIRQKFEFQLPDKPQRTAIWKKVLQKIKCLDSDVDPNNLGTHQLTGGEISNVVQRAVARAYCRGKDFSAESITPVTQEDLLSEINVELENGFIQSDRKSIQNAMTLPTQETAAEFQLESENILFSRAVECAKAGEFSEAITCLRDLGVMTAREIEFKQRISNLNELKRKYDYIVEHGRRNIKEGRLSENSIKNVKQMMKYTPNSLAIRELDTSMEELIARVRKHIATVESARSCGDFETAFRLLAIAEKLRPGGEKVVALKKNCVDTRREHQRLTREIERKANASIPDLNGALQAVDRLLAITPDSKIAKEWKHDISVILNADPSIEECLSAADFITADMLAANIPDCLCDPARFSRYQIQMRKRKERYMKSMQEASTHFQQGKLKEAQQSCSQALSCCPFSDEVEELNREIERVKTERNEKKTLLLVAGVAIPAALLVILAAAYVTYGLVAFLAANVLPIGGILFSGGAFLKWLSR